MDKLHKSFIISAQGGGYNIRRHQIVYATKLYVIRKWKADIKNVSSRQQLVLIFSLVEDWWFRQHEVADILKLDRSVVCRQLSSAKFLYQRQQFLRKEIDSLNKYILQYLKH